MVIDDAPSPIGRDEALELVRGWAGGIDAGPSALLISGEAGIGKTTVWEFAIDVARQHGARIAVARPAETEVRLAYAGLTDLLVDLIEPVLVGLPDAQAGALASALALESAVAPIDSLLVARATRLALDRLADEAPIVLAIDDVQWLDASSARVLAYALRRAGGSVSVAATLRAGFREPLQAVEAVGERRTQVHLEGLSLGAIARLVRERTESGISRRRLAQLHDQARGNPLYAIELARAPLGELPDSLSEGLLRHLDEAPSSARRAIEEIAVLGPRPLATFDDLAEVDAAVDVGILTADRASVRFSHPLLAAAAYQRIPPGRRASLHLAAAQTAASPGARARHLALATTQPDESVAAMVAEAAAAERRRGAPEAAAELAGEARRLTPPEAADALAARTVDQAEYLFLAADEAGAEALLDSVIDGPARGATRVRALLQRAMTESTPLGAVSRLEAATLEPNDDPVLTARTLAQLAWQRGAWLGDVEPAVGEAEHAVALAESAGDPASVATALTTLGLLQSISTGRGAQASFERALAIAAGMPSGAVDHSPNIAYAHERLWRADFASAERLFATERRSAVERGDDGLLLRIDIFSADMELRRGRWSAAERLLESALDAAPDYWRLSALTRRGVLRAHRGNPSALDDATELRASPVAAGDPVFEAVADFVTGLRRISDGSLGEGASLMARLPELTASHPSRGAEFGAVIPEVVAALAAAGDLDRAAALTGILGRRQPIFEPWGNAAMAHCRGILALAAGDLEQARLQLGEAIAAYAGFGSAWDLGNALLSAGMTDRRAGRRTEAATLLQRAIAIFDDLQAAPLRQSARDELARARPSRGAGPGLTPGERRVAALAAAGRTNREIAAELFTTVTTVEAHLTRTYGKLGIRSRTELARVVGSGGLRLDEPGD